MAPPAPPGRGAAAASRATSAAGSTSTGSSPASSTTPWSCSRPTAARSSCAEPDGSGHRRGQPRPVGVLSSRASATCPAQSLPAEAVAAAPSALRRRLSRRPARPAASAPRSSRRASTPSAARPCSTAPQLLGLLNVYHDEPHPWTDDELETMAALATQASVAIRAAQDFERMATWAAQLQSIQQLGTRLSRLTGVQEIGMAIATELRQLIDYHNVRVYRLDGDDLIPVAMQGQVGEYVDETPDQLKVTVGEGITGWVAEHARRPEPRRRRQRPARRHDPGHRGRPRRVDAARADDLRRQRPRRARALEARPPPVLRRRPAAARDLRELRRAGDGQRRHDRAAARADAPRSSARSAASASSSRSPSRS